MIFTRGDMIAFRCFQTLSLFVGIFNIVLVFSNLASGSYGYASISAAAGLLCFAVAILNERRLARWRRYDRAHALKQLDECFRFGICPDCGHMSIENKLSHPMICTLDGCGSRFERDPITKEWTREDGIKSTRRNSDFKIARDDQARG